MCGQALRVCAWTLLSLSALGIVASGLLLWRLSQGPIALPRLAALGAEMVNAESDDVVVSIGNAVLTLGAAGESTGLEFQDVRAETVAGTPLLSAPRVLTRFDLVDLLAGKLRPTRFVIRGASARVLRAEDGRIRVGLGVGRDIVIDAGESADDGEAAGPQRPGMDAIARIVDGLVGDAPPVAELSRLTAVTIEDLDLTYRDALTGRSWRTRGSTLRLSRADGGVRAQMHASVTDNQEQRTFVNVSAERLRGTGRADFSMRVGNLRPQVLAGQRDDLAWLALVEGTVAGQIGFSIGPLGDLVALDAELTARDGSLPGLGPDGRFAKLAIGLAYAPELDRLVLETATLEAEALRLHAHGFVEIERAAGVEETGLAGALTLEEIRVSRPDLFVEPLRFDAGQVVFKVDLARETVEIADAWLSRGALTLGASGRVAMAPSGLSARLRLTGRSLGIPDLLAHWPLGAGKNARSWAADNLVSGQIDEMVGHLALDGGDATLALDFMYRDLVSRYLDQMSPIQGAAGRGHLTEETLHLSVSDGHVEIGESEIGIAGSRLLITEFSGDVTPADIDLRAEGRLGDALALIDQEPLGLVSKLGLDIGAVGGEVSVEAALAFPLLKDLLLEEIEIDISAALGDVALPLALMRTGPVMIEARTLALRASQTAMVIEGPAVIEGVPLALTWTERYGGTAEGRELLLAGALTPEVLASIGAPVPGFNGGAAESALFLTQRDGRTSFEVEADLTGAEVEVERMRWSKAQGVPASVSARGTLSPALSVEAVSVSGGGIELQGAVGFGESGQVETARIDRFVLDDRVDLAGRIRLGENAQPLIELEGRLLDLSDFIQDPPEAPAKSGAPVLIRLDIDEVGVTEKIRLRPARGTIERTAEGAIVIGLTGAVGNAGGDAVGDAGGGAPFSASFARAEGAPGMISVTSPDAGGLMSGLGFFVGGRGGALELDAILGPDAAAGIDLEGTLRITDLEVRDALTLGSILAEGGVDDAAEAVSGEGLRFREVLIPFRYADGRIFLDDGIARSPAVALKVKGEIDEGENRLDLVGVISPAYAVTGAINKVPVLGRILSGGEGEGIIAMTFDVTGTLDTPDFRVNPLSLLTPGVLREVFEQKARQPSARFLEGLKNTN